MATTNALIAHLERCPAQSINDLHERITTVRRSAGLAPCHNPDEPSCLELADVVICDPGIGVTLAGGARCEQFFAILEGMMATLNSRRRSEVARKLWSAMGGDGEGF